MKIKDLDMEVFKVADYVDAIDHHVCMEILREDSFAEEMAGYAGWDEESATSIILDQYACESRAEINLIKRRKPNIEESILDALVSAVESYFEHASETFAYLLNNYGELDLNTNEDIERFISMFEEREPIQHEIEEIRNVCMCSIKHAYSISCTNAEEAAKKLAWLNPVVYDNFDIQFDSPCSIGATCHALSNVFPNKMFVGRSKNCEDRLHVWRDGKRFAAE